MGNPDFLKSKYNLHKSSEVEKSVQRIESYPEEKIL